MKKLIALLLALLCIVITVSACKGNGDEEETTQKEEITTAKPAPQETESETYEDPEGLNYGPIHGVNDN